MYIVGYIFVLILLRKKNVSCMQSEGQSVPTYLSQVYLDTLFLYKGRNFFVWQEAIPRNTDTSIMLLNRYSCLYIPYTIVLYTNNSNPSNFMKLSIFILQYTQYMWSLIETGK